MKIDPAKLSGFANKILHRLKKKEENKEFFLCLLFKAYSVGALLFEKKGEKLRVIAKSEKEIDIEVESLEEAELVQLCDNVISQTEQYLPLDVELKKTIFAVPYHFVDGGKINKEYLVKFKRVCEELDLTPIGFIVTIEALIHAVARREGIPISAIFVEINKKSVVIYLVRSSDVVELKDTDHAGSYPRAVEILLKGVTSFETLPSKMILINDEGVEGLQQQFLSFPWTKDLPFLHLPQVSLFEKGFEQEAIVTGVATQMGSSVFMNDFKDEKRRQADNSNDEGVIADQESDEKNEEFGFVKERDVAVESEEEIIESEDVEPPGISDDISESSESQAREVEEELPTKRTKTGLSLGGFFSSFNILNHFKNVKILGFLMGVILLLGAFVYFYYMYLLKAEIILFLDKKIISKQEDIKLSETSPTSASKKILKMSYVTFEEEGTKSSDTTGKKATGEKARGEVVVYNKAEDKKNFDKGTIIVGPNRLEYELLDSVNIASTSAFSTNFSSAKVKVQAMTFGSEYNVPSASNFTVKNVASSVIFAKNDEAFSGGTKQEIQVVSDEDLKDLEATILEEFKGKVSDDIKSKISDSDVLVPSIMEVEFAKKTFDKKAGDEAKKVTLSAKITFKQAYYSEQDLERLMKEFSFEDAPTNYEFVSSESKARVKDIVSEKNETSGVFEMRAVFIPKIDEQKIIDSVVGGAKASVEKTISETSNVGGGSIRLKNSVPFMPELMPFNRENIKVIFNTNG